MTLSAQSLYYGWATKRTITGQLNRDELLFGQFLDVANCPLPSNTALLDTTKGGMGFVIEGASASRRPSPTRLKVKEVGGIEEHVMVGADEATLTTPDEANHFLDPVSIGITEPESDYYHSSYTRCERMKILLDSQPSVTISSIQSYLQDHTNAPQSICAIFF